MKNLSNIMYFAHDLDDAAIIRRVEMLKEQNYHLTIIGFRRNLLKIDTVAGIPALDLGRTHNKKLVLRSLSVLCGLFAVLRLMYKSDRSYNVFVARNLEMLIISVFVKKFYKIKARIVYEVLDIHRIFYGKKLLSSLFRAIEGRLLSCVDAVIISSPAFEENHFKKIYRNLPSFVLIENKILESEARFYEKKFMPDCTSQNKPKIGAPWVIAWVGVLRCKKSFDILLQIAAALPEKVVVKLHGKPALDEISDFYQRLHGIENIKYYGPFDRRTELAAIYDGADFVWAIDYYDEDMNSKWLLPNRLYEGGFFGVVPIATDDSEIGRWLAKHGAGVIVSEPIVNQLISGFSDFDRCIYAAKRSTMLSIGRDAFIFGPRDWCRLQSALFNTQERSFDNKL